MSELRALLFDVDGTLADTERDGHRVAFNRAFREAGLDWDWTPELYGALLAVTGGKERMLYYLERFRPDFARPADLAGFVAGLHGAKTRHYTEMLDSGAIPLRPGGPADRRGTRGRLPARHRDHDDARQRARPAAECAGARRVRLVRHHRRR